MRGPQEFFQQAAEELTTWAANELELSTIPQGAEMTLRACLKQVSKQTKTPNPKLELSKKRPEALFYLWEVFIELYRVGERLSYQEIWSWSNLMQYEITPDEVSLIRKIDNLANGR